VTIRGPKGARETHEVKLPAYDDSVSSLSVVAAPTTLTTTLTTNGYWFMSRLPKGFRTDLENE
jgi:hypothetical protein